MFLDTEAKKQMRIAIANDVLDMLDMRLVRVVENNAYVNIDEERFNSNTVCDVLPKLRPDKNVCTVCAIGIALVSSARMGSVYACGVKFSSHGTWVGYQTLLDTLTLYFSSTQLAAIETAFEGHSVITISGEKLQQINRVLWQGAIRVREPYLTNKPRIDAESLCREIWTNIATNDGTFIP